MNLCLNCDKPLVGDYCSHCGQSASTHRFTLKHIFTQDFIRVIFFIQRGFFYSLKELFTRPGHSIRDYIKGKRVRHLNYFTLLVVVLIIFSLVEQITPFHFTELASERSEVLESVDLVLRKHSKLVYVSILPIYALFSFLVFRKARQNYAEHFVLNTYRVTVIVTLNIIFICFASFIRDISVIKMADNVMILLVNAYGTWFFYQYFSTFYKNRILLLVKSLVSVLLPALFIIALLVTFFVIRGEAG